MDPLKGHYNKPHTTHHRMLFRFLEAWFMSPNKRILSCQAAFQQTQYESIEPTVRTGKLMWSGLLFRIGDHRLPKRIMSRELENAGKQGPGGRRNNGRTAWQRIVG